MDGDGRPWTPTLCVGRFWTLSDALGRVWTPSQKESSVSYVVIALAHFNTGRKNKNCCLPSTDAACHYHAATSLIHNTRLTHTCWSQRVAGPLPFSEPDFCSQVVALVVYCWCCRCNSVLCLFDELYRSCVCSTTYSAIASIGVPADIGGCEAAWPGSLSLPLSLSLSTLSLS